MAYEIIDSAETDGLIFEVLEYQNLAGVTDTRLAEELYFAQKSGLKLRQVRIRMTREDSEIVTEAGSLQYHKGRIRQENKVGGVKGLATRFIQSKTNNEEIFRPSYVGEGVVYLEPSFEHFTLVEMNGSGQGLILDKDIFYCSSAGIDIGVKTNKDLFTGKLGSEGWFQTKATGRGILVVSLPVPESELRVESLEDEMLSIDGEAALMYEIGLDFKVRKSNKRWLRTAFSGEGFLETFEGTGNVFLAPTAEKYKSLEERYNARGIDHYEFEE